MTIFASQARPVNPLASASFETVQQSSRRIDVAFRKQNPREFDRKTSPDHVDERMVLSRVSHDGKWTPASMVRTYADGRRASFNRTGRRWSATAIHAKRLANGPGIGFGGARLERTSGQSFQPPEAAVL
jgi:hypothetical protein